ncbi:MAG: hypothetical protein VKJ46_13945, partial [Leptolyngbyaceae bacterium]|nr:hypothetical protein [Leptolyngbyaceae bacterium]
MNSYPKIQTFLHERASDGMFARFIGILGVDLLLIQAIGTKGFDEFLETLNYYFGSYTPDNDLIAHVQFMLAGSIAKYLIPLFLITLWFFKEKVLLKKFFFVYLAWVNLKFLITLLFLIIGLWSPTASG